jgi:site-specific recombinase XerD
MKTRFFLKSNPSNSKGSIYFLFSTGYGKIKVSTGEKIPKKDWATGLPKNSVSTTEIRSRLTSFQIKIDKKINDLIERQNRMPNKAELVSFCKSTIKGDLNIENYIYLSDLINQFLTESETDTSKPLQRGTITYKKIHLTDFLEYCGTRSVVSELNVQKIEGYKSYLFRNSNQNSTKNNYRKSIISFLNWLKYKGISSVINNIEFKKFVMPDKDVISLTEKELLILEKAKLTPILQKQIDVFLFGCYTALSISDIINISKDKIENNILHTRRVKTDEILRIPLIKEARIILEKYDYNFQSVNPTSGRVQLKTAFKELGLNRKVRITSKVGGRRTEDKMVPLHQVISWHKTRKTTITTLLSKGVDHTLVMLISGHKDYRSFRQYIDSTDILVKEMEKLSKKDDNKNEE